MTKRSLTSIFLAIALSSRVLPSDFTPHFEQATMRSETTEFRKLRVQSPWQDQHQVGGRRLAIDGDGVIERSPDNAREVRRIRSPKGAKLLWLAAADGIACFAIDDPSSGQFVGDYLVPPVIERLDLRTMQWLPSLRIEATEHAEKAAKDQGKETTNKRRRLPRDVRKQTVLGAGAAWRQTIVALLYETRSRENDVEVDGCEVICVEPQSGKTKWSTLVAWEGNETLPYEVLGTPIGHVILRERRPPLQQHVQLLSIREDRSRRPPDSSEIFVCPGRGQNLVCLSADSGKEQWRMSRIWELDRSYSVPSGISITRFGLEGWGVGAVDEAVAADGATTPERMKEIEENKKRLVAARPAFNKKYGAHIAAGPMITNDPLQPRVFIAVARGHKSKHGMAVTDSLIYEINPKGWVESMTTVPHEVFGWPCKALDDSVVWACELDSYVRVASGSADPFHGQELTCIEWYREIPIWTRTNWACENAWLHADPDRYAACFSDQWLFRAVRPTWSRGKNKAIGSKSM